MTPASDSVLAAPGILTEDDTVTGDAVALDLPPAGIGTRLISGAIDVVVTLLTFLLTIVLSLTAVANTDEALGHVAMIGSLVFSFVFVPTMVTTLSRGKSLGRWITGLRIVRDDAGPISTQHAFFRTLVGFIEIYLLSGAPAFFSILLSSKGKRLGDYAAGTYVVRERVRWKPAPRPTMPPHLAVWAANADMTALPVSTSLAVRQFLAQAGDAGNEARSRVGTHLAVAVTAHVSPPPPAGTHPEDFLAAVLVERGRRDALRLERDEALRQRLRAGVGTGSQ